MTASAPPSPPRQRRKEARPQELLEAALSLFVEKGFAATRSEEVAARAGVSKGTLYLYYPSKEELLKAVIRENLSRMLADGASIAAGFTGPASELLAVLMRTWWERVGNTPAGGIHKIIMSEVRNFPEIAEFYNDEIMTPGHELVVSVIERGIRTGEFRDMPVHEMTHLLISPLIFLALHKHSFGACPVGSDVDPERLLEVQIDLILHGILAPAPHSPQKASR